MGTHVKLINIFETLPMMSAKREGVKYDHEPINIYSRAQVVCKIYSIPLRSYLETLNFVPNPAIFSQQLYFCYLFYQFTLSLNILTKLSGQVAIQNVNKLSTEL